MAVVLAGCAKTGVTPTQVTWAPGRPAPSKVLVYHFAVTPGQVRENQSIIQRAVRSGSSTTPQKRNAQIGHQVSDRMTVHLVAGITALGLPAEVAALDRDAEIGEMQIVGQFLRVDEGNRLKRTVIGFGAGGSKVDVVTQVYYVTDRGARKMLEFRTHADSGKMPGAAVTMGAGAAAQGGVTAGVAAANVATGSIKAYKSEVDRMAAKSADEAVKYLGEFFQKQGWIRPGQVKSRGMMKDR